MEMLLWKYSADKITKKINKNHALKTKMKNYPSLADTASANYFSMHIVIFTKDSICSKKY